MRIQDSDTDAPPCREHERSLPRRAPVCPAGRHRDLRSGAGADSSCLNSWLTPAVSFELVVQCHAVDAQNLSSTRLIPAGGLERSQDVRLLNFIQTLRSTVRNRIGLKDKVRFADLRFLGHHHRPFDGIFKLANVAGPWLLL